jgi:hypothetical protein
VNVGSKNNGKEGRKKERKDKETRRNKANAFSGADSPFFHQRHS